MSTDGIIHGPQPDEPLDGPPKGWLSTESAAEYADLSVHTIRHALQVAELSGCKVGTKWLTTCRDVDAWIETYRVAPRRARRRTA